MDDLATLYVLIRRFEGCRLIPYLCPAGVWTCGWGSTGPDVFPGRAWTQAYADRRLELDGIKYARGARALCPRLRGEALCAIADFAYNVGLGALQASTLRRRLNLGQYERAAVELKRWVWAAGRKLPGLVLRRAVEADILLDSARADR